MNKPELESLVRVADRQIGLMLQRLRPNGECEICEAKIGEKHNDECPVWPLIKWRRLKHVAEERDAESL